MAIRPARLNQDVVNIIAKYVDPELDVFCRLASVNRTFYQVFTREIYWRQFNLYNVEENFYAEFTRRLDDNTRILLKQFWSESDNHAKNVTTEALRCLTDNKFVWLGHICRNQDNLADFLETNPEMVDWYLEHFHAEMNNTPLIRACQDDRELGAKVIKSNGLTYEIINAEYKNEAPFPELAVTAPCIPPTMNFITDPQLQSLSDEWKRNERICRMAIDKDPRSVSIVPAELQEEYFNNREWILQAVERAPEIMQNERFKVYADDEEVFTHALLRKSPDEGNYHSVIGNFSDAFQHDYEKCSRAITANPVDYLYCKNGHFTLLHLAIEKASERGIWGSQWLNAKHFVPILAAMYGPRVDALKQTYLKILKCSAKHYRHFPESIREDPEVALKACENHPPSIQYLPLSLQSQGEFMAKVLPLCAPNAFFSLDSQVLDNIHDHMPILMAAIQAGTDPVDIDEKLHTQFRFQRQLYKLFLENIKFERITQKTIENYPEVYTCDYEMAKLAVTRKGCFMQRLIPNLKKDKIITDLAFERDTNTTSLPGQCFPYAFLDGRWMRDANYMFEKAMKCGMAPLRRFGEEQFAVACLKYFPHLYQYLNEEMKNSVVFNRSAAEANVETMSYMSEEMQRNPAVTELINWEWEPDRIYCHMCKERLKTYITKESLKERE